MYHLGKAKQRATANANASVVWPDGKEGLPPAESFSMKSYVWKGRGRSMVNLRARLIKEASVSEDNNNIALFFNCEPFITTPSINNNIVVPQVIKEIELLIN